MDYFLEFSADNGEMDMCVDSSPSTSYSQQRSPMTRSFERMDSCGSLGLADLEDFSYAENVVRRSENTVVANAGGMWQGINKRSSVHEGERPAKRTKSASSFGNSNMSQGSLCQSQNDWMLSAGSNHTTSTSHTSKRPVMRSVSRR